MTKLEMDVEIMRAAGLEDGEIARLAWLKQRIDHGDCTELTREYKRLAFFKFLYDEGRIRD
jgi:hypothetical protein